MSRRFSRQLTSLGSATAQLTTKDLLIRFARQPSHAALFNYASMAHNNHFFFAGLQPQPSKGSGSHWFSAQIAKSFSSFDSFRQTFIATANAMFGPGFTWLVARRDPMMPRDGNGYLAILNTYLAGSPYPQAHFRSQSEDMNTADTAVPAGEHAQTWALKQGGASGVGLHGIRGLGAGFGRLQKGYLAPGGQDLQVLMCVSTWEHVWLPDYGIGGKQAYLENIWEHIDWTRAEANWSERPRNA
jgi:superoxide dismutase, Fe-Mn family